MDFDQLETFLEVARNLSFSRAAEKRFRTQPAISAQIRALEEELGVKLLDRSGGRVALTQEGKFYLGYVEQTLEQRRVMLSAIAELDRVPRGEIVVGANEGTCLHILPEVFAQFKALYPDVSITVLRSESREVLERVVDNSIDFGVVAMPVDDKRLATTIIHRDHLVVITAPGHPLAAKDQVTMSEVGKYPLLVPKFGRTRDALDKAFSERDIKPNISMELDSSELTKRFVAAGVGVGFIASFNLGTELKLGLLGCATIKDAVIRRDIALVFRRDKTLSRAATAFIEIALKLKAQQAATS